MNVEQVLLKDRFWLTKNKKQQASLDSSSEAFSVLEQKIQQRFERSAQALEQRLAIDLDINYPDLPVCEAKDQILALLEKHQVLVIAGQTGSGKTTQLPKMCLQAGLGRKAMIAHTQPRRVAARSVAKRISDELNVNLGEEVGYQVRFNDQSNDTTLLKLMTDGVLLAEIAHDRFLEKYDCIIIDEAHERSLNIDFLLGYLKKILPKRPDLKVIITSATIDVERFSKHFDNAPVLNVEGRTYPVTIHYQDEVLDLEQDVLDILQHIDAQARSKHTQPADVLIFLTGEKDIRELSRFLRKQNQLPLQVLPLYSRLSVAEQDKIFNPQTSQQRVILTTNVAETSLTVPGIGYVIDTGLARMSRYSVRNKVQQLPIEKISQASANQRAGRCGRISAGECFRLYSEEDFVQRSEFTDPEIKRTNLAAVILQMHLLRMGDIKHFPFVQAPDSRLINDGVKQLFELGALDGRNKLTNLGRKMANLPIDPKFAAILLQADKQRSLQEALIIISGLSIQDVKEEPADKKEAARQKHSEFKDAQSDFVAMLNLWKFLEENRQELSGNQFKKLCQRQFLSVARVFEWRELHRQLLSICQQMKLTLNQEPADYASIHKALLAGFALNIGQQEEKKQFQGTRNKVFNVFPGSYVYKKPPKWLMAAQLIETSQLFAHKNAQIEPQWLNQLLPHLLKYHYSEPHFSAEQGQVMAYRQTRFYGLVIADKERMSYGKIDSADARKIFILEALVYEKLKASVPFLNNNKKIKAQILKQEDQHRRRDLLVIDDDIVDFYDARLPAHIVNQASLLSWYKKADKNSQQSLFASLADFQSNTADADQAQFPKRLAFDDVSFALRYRFEPGHKADGVSVDVPLVMFNRLPKFLLEWLVPGLLPEKVEALLKTLPKTQRKRLMPIADTAKLLVPHLQASDTPLAIAISEAIKKVKQLNINSELFQSDKLDGYYSVNIRLLNERNQLLEQSRDLAYLQKKYAGSVQKRLNTKVEQDNKRYRQWDFADLQAKMQVQQGKTSMVVYPAIESLGDEVKISQLSSRWQQQQVHRLGLNTLAMNALTQQKKYLQKQLFKQQHFALQLPKNLPLDDLKTDLLKAAFDKTFFNGDLVFEQAALTQTLQHNKAHLTNHANELESIVVEVIKLAFEARKALPALQNTPFAIVADDVAEQMQALLSSNFLYTTPMEYLRHYPRYFKAIAARIERLQGNVAKEQRDIAELDELNQQMLELIEQEPAVRLLPSLQSYRWMIEEYRVSLFAQRLKTAFAVSRKRLDKAWQQVLDEKARTLL